MGSMFLVCAIQDVKDMMAKSKTDLLSDEVTETGLLKRWQEISPNFREFYEHAKVGDIFRTPQFSEYGAHGCVYCPQQFRNTPTPEPPVYQNGTTVIEFGFVDLMAQTQLISTEPS